MKFARIVFIMAGIWGIAVLTPFYWLVDVTGRQYQPPLEYPHFFYGFFSVAIAWQIGFLLIGMQPARLRAMMIPSIVEKMGYVVTVTSLYARGRISWSDAQTAVPDLLFGLLFIMAFRKTRAAGRAGVSQFSELAN